MAFQFVLYIDDKRHIVSSIIMPRHFGIEEVVLEATENISKPFDSKTWMAIEVPPELSGATLTVMVPALDPTNKTNAAADDGYLSLFQITATGLLRTLSADEIAKIGPFQMVAIKSSITDASDLTMFVHRVD